MSGICEIRNASSEQQTGWPITFQWQILCSLHLRGSYFVSVTALCELTCYFISHPRCSNRHVATRPTLINQSLTFPRECAGSTYSSYGVSEILTCHKKKVWIQNLQACHFKLKTGLERKIPGYKRVFLIFFVIICDTLTYWHTRHREYNACPPESRKNSGRAQGPEKKFSTGYHCSHTSVSTDMIRCDPQQPPKTSKLAQKASCSVMTKKRIPPSK